MRSAGLENHDKRADVDHSLAVIYAPGVEPRPDVIREQAAINEVVLDQARSLVAMNGRRLQVVG